MLGFDSPRTSSPGRSISEESTWTRGRAAPAGGDQEKGIVRGPPDPLSARDGQVVIVS
jgi:hypothetical protein